MDLQEILNKTQTIAKKAGSFIRKESQHFSADRIEQKGFNDLVSYVDKEAERIIVDSLSLVLPEAGFITEEGTNTTQKPEWNWIIDPLDGTTNFVHGLPVYSVSIALQHQREIVLGVVYEINLHECFYAIKGHGAFCNDTRISVSNTSSLSSSLVATGFPYSDLGMMDEYLGFLKYLLKNSHGIRRLGSAAVDLCYVACGRVEAYFEYNLNAYDVAAGAIILTEAGGRVTDFNSGSNYIFGREILGSNGLVHEEILNPLKTHFRT